MIGLISEQCLYQGRGVERGTYLPPRKCLPLNHFTRGFGAVRLISEAGWNPLPGPELGGPVSIFHDDGASTERTGTFVSRRASMMEGNGSLTSPEKLKPWYMSQRWRVRHTRCGGDVPNIASTTWSVSLSAARKSSVNGISKSSNCLDNRYHWILASSHGVV